ncbi:SDR family NAD(P)-dependent oxidoreductase [Methylocella sp.]|uniref:SDR family NAD(P)-dependent oxidoreductase n=1 Tax=Methylocella sp. TaxID=1978226 RepID=UPI003782F2F9
MPQTDDFRAAARPVTLVTGASGGIGADLARVFAEKGHDLALVARGAPALEAVAAEIEATGRPRPLTFALDLAEADAVDRLERALRGAGARVEILVNNAGFGLVGEVAELSEAGQLAMIDLNVRALTQLCVRFLADVKAARGKILNVGSVVSYFPGGPGMAVYYASKAYVLSFTRGLAQELLGTGVTVSALCPGVTPTGFQARAGFASGQLDRIPATSSRSVAEAGYGGLMRGRREIVPGAFNLMGAWLMPFAPRGALLQAVRRAQMGRR